MAAYLKPAPRGGNQEIFQQMLVAAAICFNCDPTMVLEHGKQLWFQFLESILDLLSSVFLYVFLFYMVFGCSLSFFIGKIHSQLPGIQIDETPGQDPSSKMAMGDGERW